MTISTKRLVIERSSSGAIRREVYEASPGAEHQLNTRLLFVTIRDEDRMTVLNPLNHSAQISNLEHTIHTPWKLSGMQAAKPTSPGPARSGLGHTMLAGLDVVGTHRSYAAQARVGGQGSSVQVTEETWFSPVMQNVVKSESHDDHGHSTVVTLEDIQFLEPDSSLFALPKNYSVVRK